MTSKSGLLLQRVNMFTQIQDLGRFGGAALGLSQGGVIDITSARLANALVDNAANTPLLEIGFGSIQMRAIGPLCIAVTGAAMSVVVNGKPYPRYQSLQLQDGDQIAIGYSKAGARCYLAIAGGLVVSSVLGSCATVLREGVGGIDGKALQPGMILPVDAIQTSFGIRSIAYQFQLKPKNMQNIPFVAGAQQAELGSQTLARFQSTIYRVLPMSDRMGMRLQGSLLPVQSHSLLSEGICLGAIQLPADGQPIVMLNDHQTIGGYPKLGAVTRLGVSALGQCRPGNLIRFVRLSLQQAMERARQHESWLSAMEQHIRNNDR